MEETTTTPVEQGIDYKAEYEKVQTELAEKSKRLNQAEYTLKKKNIQEKKSKDSDDFEEEVEEKETKSEELPDIDAIIEQKVSQKIALFGSDSILRKYSQNEDEINLAKFHLENTIRSTGNLEDDVQTALAIANRKSLLKRNKELAEALKNKAQITNASQGSSSDKKVPDEFAKDLTPEQLTSLKARGWNEKKIRRFIELKKTGN